MGRDARAFNGRDVAFGRSGICRSLALVDIENLHGQPRAARAGELGTIIRVLRRAAGLGPRDHIVIGCNPGLAFTAAACWPSMRLVTRRGPDGADLALLRCVDDPAFIARRYDQVVIGSGDGIFEEATIELLAAGLVVHIYSRPTALELAALPPRRHPSALHATPEADRAASARAHSLALARVRPGPRWRPSAGE